VSGPERRLARGDPRERTRRDLDRLRRREPGGRFWRSLSLLGSVGWPIVLLATGGALLGRYLDVRLGLGIRLTLMLLVVGTALGCLIAYRTLKGEGW
jgi:predicted F0F1-ATPase subunit